MNTDTPETDSVWNDKNQNILEHAKKLEQERDQLKRWKDEMETVGGWWLAVDEAIRKHPDATIGDTTPNIMLRFIRERNEAHSAIAALNQRLQERQESFQAQLIRIEEVWREKLREARQDADQLAGAIEIAIPHLPYSAGSAKARYFAVKHGNTSDEFAFKALLTSFERHEALTAKR